MDPVLVWIVAQPYRRISGAPLTYRVTPYSCIYPLFLYLPHPTLSYLLYPIFSLLTPSSHLYLFSSLYSTPLVPYVLVPITTRKLITLGAL